MPLAHGLLVLGLQPVHAHRQVGDRRLARVVIALWGSP